MPIEGTMGIRHIDNIGHIGGLIYADMQKTIVVMILISDLSGAEAVRMLFAGAAVDAETILISVLKSLEQRHSGLVFAGGAEDTETILISEARGGQVRSRINGAGSDN